MRRHRIRTRILVPIAVALATLVTAHVVGVIITQSSEFRERLAREVENVEEELAHREENDADLLLSALSAIGTNPLFKQSFLDGDREALLALATPLFEELQAAHDLTHLYFSDSDRKNFLRVHRPDLFGDRIDRFTTLQAEETGQPFAGLELGRFRGLFTLRAVAPWYHDGALIGYVELGKEIVGVTERLVRYEGVDFVLTLDKQLVERDFWEDGMRFLGRSPDWDRYVDRVLIESTMGDVPAVLELAFSARDVTGAADPSAHGLELSTADRRYMSHVIPIDDRGEALSGSSPSCSTRRMNMPRPSVPLGSCRGSRS